MLQRDSRQRTPSQASWPRSSTMLLATMCLLAAACSKEEPRYRVVADSHPTASEKETEAQAEDGREQPRDTDPEHGPEVAQASRTRDPQEPIANHVLPPARGKTITVSAGLKTRRDLAFPGDELLEALRQLEPGDRLILEPGVYEGPILIDDSMRDGRKPEPIQVVAKTDAVLAISDKNSTATAVLEVQRSFWEFHGLEVLSPQTGVRGIELNRVKTVLLADCHIHDLGGAGIRLGERVREVRIERSHIHQIGLGRRKEDAHGIIVTDPTSRLVLTDINLHHTHLAPISVPGGMVKRLSDAERWSQLEIERSEIK